MRARFNDHDNFYNFYNLDVAMLPLLRSARPARWSKNIEISAVKRRFLGLSSPANRRWPQSQSRASVRDDEVARLASRPLHALSLVDLVR